MDGMKNLRTESCNVEMEVNDCLGIDVRGGESVWV